jgi:DNA-binding MarR family transcriptional regulator
MYLKELDKTIFYTIDKSIKTYRQFAAKNIKQALGTSDITIDQWLVLKTVKDNPDLPQKEIADKVFKDYASITRIIEILVKKDYITRTFHPSDRRRFRLRLTDLGELTYASLEPIIQQNRQIALDGISKEEINSVRIILNKIIDNCLVHSEYLSHQQLIKTQKV